MKKFKARKDNYFIRSDEEASEVGNYLESQFPLGGITPESLVEVSRDSSSPTHRYFEWNDDKAASLYRLSQARTILRSIVIEVAGSDVPAYHHVYVKENQSSSYMELDRCLEVRELWAQVIESALKEAKSWSERYKTYQQLAPIRQAILAVQQEITNGNKSGHTREAQAQR